MDVKMIETERMKKRKINRIEQEEANDTQQNSQQIHNTFVLKCNQHTKSALSLCIVEMGPETLSTKNGKQSHSIVCITTDTNTRCTNFN